MGSSLDREIQNFMSKELIRLNSLRKEAKTTITESAENFPGLSAIEEDIEQSPVQNWSDVVAKIEKGKESSAATPDIKNSFNLSIKEEPEVYEIENVPLDDPYSNELIHEERKLIVHLENRVIKQNNMPNLDPHIKGSRNLVVRSENPKVIVKDGNLIIDDLNRLTAAAKNGFKEYNCIKEEALVKTETNEARNCFEQIHEVDFKEWKIKNEELDIKEDLEESEPSVVEPRVKHTTQVENFATENVPRDQSTFRKDYLTTEDAKKFKCNDCDYRTFQKGNLTIHMLRHMNLEEVKKLKCDQCKYETMYKSHFKRHLLMHVNPDDVKTFKCNDCEYQTFQKSNLKNHMIRHVNSEKVKKYKCNDCDYRTMRKSDLNSHMIRHINLEDVDDVKTFKCPECDYLTPRKRSLKVHMTIHTNSEKVKKYKCNDCDYQAFRKSYLKIHMLRHMNPEEVKKLKCGQCNFETVYNDSLKVHLLLHVNSEDAKKFKCNYCDYRAFQKGHLKIHMLRHMNPEEVKKFKCGQCNFETVYNGNLKVHLLLHVNSEDAKKFKCNYCDYRAVQKVSLKRHMMRHS